MSAIATAVVGGAVISGMAAGEAADAQSDAARDANATQLSMFNMSREDQEPWRAGGRKALEELLYGLGFNGGGSRFESQFKQSDFEADPVVQLGFKYGLDEGTKGLNRMAAARGGLQSGAQLKALTRFATDYTGTKANESYNRFHANKDRSFNRLTSLAGVGQTAAQQIGNQAIQTGQALANNITGAGNARASGYVGTANAVNGAVGTGVNMWQQNQLMNRLGGGNYSGYVGNAYQNGFGDAFTNMSNPAYG